MTNNHTTLTSLFTDIANAIRSKNGSTSLIIADNFPMEIENLKTGFNYKNDKTTVISDYEFRNCEYINNVDCYNLTSIGNGAFENCNKLKTIIIYDSVTSIGGNAFKGCNCTIYCGVDNKPDSWDENWNPDNCEVVWGYSPVETWDISATENDNVTANLYNDISTEGMYKLVITGDGNMKDYTSTNNIPWYSYYRNNIGFVYISNSVTSIGTYAFSGCTGLTSIIIPDGVTSIGNWAFSSCTGLTSINIPDGVTSIGISAFNGCTGLTSITYTGTISQWNSMTFGTDWNINTPNYTIHCIDGDIAKGGN